MTQKITASRNQREGLYVGKSQGRHIRIELYSWPVPDEWYLPASLAARGTVNYRKFCGLKEKRPAALRSRNE